MCEVTLKYLLALLVILGLTTCQTKELELTLIETACKNFKIYTPSYSWILDPSCGTTSVHGRLNISFEFSGDKDCIDRIFVRPKFYKASNTEIADINHIESFMKSDSMVIINDNRIDIIYKFEFATIEDADVFNHVYFKIHTENELGNKSKNLEIRINGKCSTVDANTYSVVKEITVDTTTVEVQLKDDASEDGDIVSVYLNGKWVLENYTLTNTGEIFAFPVKVGDNHLVLFAVNEGKVGPNTVALSINGTSINVSPDLLKGEAVNIKRF